MDGFRFLGSPRPFAAVSSSVLPSPARATLWNSVRTDENIEGGEAVVVGKVAWRGEGGSSFIILPLIYFTTELIKKTYRLDAP